MGGLQEGEDLGGDLVGFGEVVGVFEAVIFEPREVEVILSVFDLLAGEVAETSRFAEVFAWGVAVGVIAKGFFKGFEFFAGEGGSFAEGRHIGAEVIDPDALGIGLFAASTREEEDVGFDALGVKDAGGEAKDGVKVTLLHEIIADIATGIVFKEDVIGEDDSGASVGLEVAVDMLEEGKLFVCGGVGEIAACGHPAAFFGAKGGIAEDDIGGREGFAKGGEGITDEDIAVDVVEHEVHHGEAMGILDKFNAIKGLVALEEAELFGERGEVVGLLFDVFVGFDEKAARPCGGILDAFACFGSDDRNDAFDQGAGGEVLSSARFDLAGVLFEQAFVEVAESFASRLKPIERMDGRHKRLEVTRDFDRGGGICKDHLDAGAAVCTKVEQQATVKFE